MTFDLSGKTMLVTGATGGIGKETARELARMGARVFVVGRSAQKTADAAREVGAAGHLVADLSEMSQVRRAAAEFRDREERLDVLVNNAGAFYAERQETREGVEMTWALNHLAAFLLTRELLPLLRESRHGRVVTVSSAAHAQGRIRWDDPEFRRGYRGWAAYGQSKLANVLFARELARREPGLMSNSLHPGLVRSGFAHNNGGLIDVVWRLVDRFGITPQEGAQTSIRLAADPSLLVSGRYFSGGRGTREAPQARDDEAAARLWALSEEYVGG
ncbi:NAD(P)-dependent dehydrogenase (short-subunit alcohol dehydrogenase family) [Deinococcus sp. HSC-46F16]|uniref:SDR family oxidoreductase n=1 Tax=Deinococcus sp. HSC-46F16 TaxID=2910968 RepID=UPI00209DA6BC|nr:SDR family oxidoreductase [Deinococcus sp. HSC-46F16]MCP2013554.1 NAD(P)-dependent dehydrogenase (short-subunit alcohol dehydrogenase family) [Deinococcus sp. HSC-46F16]